MKLHSADTLYLGCVLQDTFQFQFPKTPLVPILWQTDKYAQKTDTERLPTSNIQDVRKLHINFVGQGNELCFHVQTTKIQITN